MCGILSSTGQGPVISINRDWELPSFDEDILERMVHLRKHCRCSEVKLDLSGMPFVTPFGLVGAAMICRYLNETANRKVWLEIPQHSDVASYMDRMGFFQTVEPWAKPSANGWHRGFQRSRGESPVLLELTKIEEADDTRGAVEQVRKKADSLLRQQFNYTSDDIAKFCTALSETCENISMHSQDWGFIAIQSYRDKVKMAIFDLGIGIQASLSERAERLGKRWSDCDSILQAMEWGVSRFDDRGRGIGLAGVKDIVRKWRGAMQIRSGTGKISINNQRMRGVAIPDLPHFPGTQICITLPKLSANVVKEECEEYEVSY